MPISSDLRPDQQLVIFRHIGDVPDDEFLAFYKEFFENPGGTYTNLLIDLEQTSSVARSPRALESLSQLLREKLGDAPTRRRVAVVAPADLSFGLARMYEVFSDHIPWEFAVFRESESARAWLGFSRSNGTADRSDAQQTSENEE